MFHHLVRDACSRYNQKTPPIPSPEYIQELQARGWEGNVRELRNEADKFVLGLPESSPTNTKNGVQLSIQQALKNPPSGLNNQLAAVEKNLIAQELTRNKGDIKRTYTNWVYPGKPFTTASRPWDLNENILYNRIRFEDICNLIELQQVHEEG